MAKTTTASPADAILAFLKAHPGGHERADIMAATKLSVATTKRVLNDLQRQHKVQLRGWAKQARWYLASENTPAIASGKKAGAKSPKPAKAKPNLADYGAASKPAPKTGVAFAIDATGTVAIENLRLPPAEIERLVDFLQRTQHVWKGAPA